MNYIQWQIVVLFLMVIAITINSYLILSGVWNKIFTKFWNWYDSMWEDMNV
jgi:hypothetical protein